MNFGLSSELPKIDSRHSRLLANQSMPFAMIMKDIQEKTLSTAAPMNRERRKSQEIFVPSGIKTYSDVSLQELTVRSRFKPDDYKQRYMNVLYTNPRAFHKQTGEFTLYSDFSVKINRTGPYNKKN